MTDGDSDLAAMNAAIDLALSAGYFDVETSIERFAKKMWKAGRAYEQAENATLRATIARVRAAVDSYFSNPFESAPHKMRDALNLVVEAQAVLDGETSQDSARATDETTVNL